MAIAIVQRRHNTRASLETYVTAGLVTTDGVKVRFPCVPFQETGLSEWVELYYLNKDPRRRFRNVGSGVPGQDVSYLFQVMCFVRVSSSTNAYALSTLRDKVLGRLHDKTEISIKNYYGNETATTVDTGVVYLVSENDVPPDVVMSKVNFPGENLMAIALTYELRYIEPHGST